MTPVPDSKDWTWVTERACPDCGLDAAAVPPGGIAGRLDANAGAWEAVLAGPDPTLRPAGDVWSPLEYACHLRDVHRLFAGRIDRMLAEDAPALTGWDQDEAAVEGRYGEQDPGVVAEELVAAAGETTRRYDAVAEAQWQRTGLRDDGTVFTVASLGRYHLHEAVHHLWDVRGAAR